MIAVLMAAGLLAWAVIAIREQEAARLIGKTKEQVVSEMGPPRKVLIIPSDLQGFVLEPPRPTRGEVLMYPEEEFEWPWVEWIYLNERGIVVHVETEGT